MDLAPSLRSLGPRHQDSANSGPSRERSLGLGRVWAAAGVLVLAGFDYRSSSLMRNHALVSAFAFTIYSLLVLFRFENPKNGLGTPASNSISSMSFPSSS